MSGMINVYSRTFLVHGYEADGSGRAKPLTLLNYLQESAGDHTSTLGISISDMQARKLTWVLFRYRLEIDQYPAAGERVEVRTWPSRHQGLRALREFEMRGDTGRMILRASSTWLLIGQDNRRPLRLDEHLPSLPLMERRALDTDFRSLPGLGQADGEIVFRVNYADLDRNRHVNNAVIINWALESVPAAILQTAAVSEIAADFQGEAFLGQAVVCRRQQQAGAGPPCFLHQLLRADDGLELARLSTCWRVASGAPSR